LKCAAHRARLAAVTDFLILGAGALGSILAAHLVRAGERVQVLARGRRAAQIRTQGLRIRGLVQIEVPVAVLEDPAHCPEAGTLIVCTKARDTRATLEPLRGMRIESVLSVQNGVLKDVVLTELFGRERVLGALADTSGELEPDGTVLFTRNECLALGELRGSALARAAPLAARLSAAGIAARAFDDIESLEWSKFTAWAALMVLSVSTRAPTAAFLTDPNGARLLVRLVREMGALAAAQGAVLVDAVTLPVATLCSGPTTRAEQIVHAFGRDLGARAPGHRMSSLQDLLAGRPLEIEETLGDALERAARLGLELPLLGASRDLAAMIDRLARIAR
jgi:2-dehydropantoate 2-reductase